MKMNKKVLIFADTTSIHTKKWIEGWEFLEYDCILSGFSSKNYDNKRIFNTNLNIDGGNGKKFLKKIFTFKKILNEENPYIINAHYLTSYGFISSIIKRKKDKLILSLHGTDVMQTMNSNFIYLVMAKFVFRKSDLLISVSNTMTKKILEHFPEFEHKILTQQYGLDLELLDTLNTDEKNIEILTNRGWVENSNYEILLKIFSKYIDKNIAILGYNSSDYAKELYQKYEVLQSLIYTSLPYQKSLSLVAKTKIFVSLTSSDGTSLSLLEAIYLGAVPIVSDLPTNHEVIIHGENGYIVPIDENALAEMIDYVLTLSEEKIQSIQEKNKLMVAERFCMKKNFTKMHEVLASTGNI